MVELIDVVLEPQSERPCLVLEHAGTNLSRLRRHLSDADIRHYIFELLKALDYCHSQGIMHRDVKPRNVCIDLSERKLRLIDWGLAEFYHPEQNYGLKVSSLHYKAPEVLVGFSRYHYSFDVWSVGCILAGLIFKRQPFFNGEGSDDQLVRIVEVLGSDDLNRYLDKYRLKLDKHFNDFLPTGRRQALSRFVTKANRHLVNPEVLDLIDKMLVYDHSARLLPKECIEHPYFDSVRFGQHRPSSEPSSSAKLPSNGIP
jgi:casein kinase II subunit alpha